MPGPTVANPATFTAGLESGLSGKRLPALDGIRAVAVFLVIFYHAGIPGVPGGLGVLLFFVLSGFLITWLMLGEVERSRTVSLRKFYARRSLRIFPAFYAYAMFILSYALLRGRAVVWPQVVASLLYVNNYWQGLHGDPGTGFSHTWSLAVEEQFYLLWPAVFVMFCRNGRHLVRFLCVSIILVWVYRFLLVPHVNQGYVYEAFDTRADSLLCGCLLAVVLRHHIWIRFFRGLCSGPAMGVMTILLLMASSLAELLAGTDYRDRFGFAINSVLAAVLLTQAIALRATPLFAWLERRWVRYLGGISYSLYLWQQFAIPAAERALLPFGRGIAVVGETIACIAAASVSYFVIERPALRLKERFEV
jgi:peptidoglycan/LPS O-acetylase OafA/YrhL